MPYIQLAALLAALATVGPFSIDTYLPALLGKLLDVTCPFAGRIAPVEHQPGVTGQQGQEHDNETDEPDEPVLGAGRARRRDGCHLKKLLKGLDGDSEASAALDGFRHMGGAHSIGAVHVRNCTRDLQDAMVAAGGKAEAIDGGL